MSHLTRGGAVLAGGQATRFGGHDKSALLLDGHPILDHQIAALTSVVDEAVYTGACLEPVAARLADRRLKMRELVDSLRTRVVTVDEVRQFGDPDRLLAKANMPADYAGLEALQGHKL